MSSAVIAKGSASILINPQETEARLVFVPAVSDKAPGKSDAEGWDAAAVNKLAADKHLGAYPDPKVIESFLQKAAKAKTAEPLEMVYCQGVEPEEPVGERVSWEALPVPDDMAAFREGALAGAGVPVIYRTRVERIKHEKKIVKPGPLPFMPGKEEIAVSWEKREIREEAAVNTEVLEVKYADKDAKLGTVSPSVPGKPGKSIFGRPIPPRTAGDGTCLLGEGIARNKNELFALISGFLRIGENWADMISLSRPIWSINTGVDGLTLFFRFEPGDVRFAPPTGKEVLAAAVARGAAEGSMVSAEELDAAIGVAINTKEALEAFSLFRIQEAQARVDISPDKTRAALYLRKGVAGALPLGMKAISQAIKDSGVHGFDAEKLKDTIHAFMTGKDLELRDYVLVEGAPSTRGEDRKIELAVSLLSAGEQKPVLARIDAWNSRDVSEDEQFDFRKATGFAFVEKNTVIARVSDAAEGEAGKDIYGNVIPGLPGNDPDIKLFRGLEMHGSSIVSSRNGLLLMEESEKSFRGEVIAYRDARIGVHISEDAMEAEAELFREEGAGIPLSVENVLKALAALGIKKGIDLTEVEKACALARAKESVSGHILARGEPALAAGGSAVKWLLPVILPELSETETEGSTVQVKAGVPIAELSEPAAEGRPGYDVKGTEIPVDKGTALAVEHDDSVLELPIEKGKRLVAGRSGELCFDGRELKISPVRIIQGDAGPSTGNIKFSGEIRISGNVLPGCVVIGESHVSVGGIAESAFVSAGGKAVITLGFRGGGKGVLRARAGIETAFVERASVMAVGDIKLSKGSILSIIKTNGKLRISAEDGRLSGGVCQARRGIDAADMGSEKGVRTELSFGQDYLIKEQIGVCEEEIAKARRILSEVEEKIKAALQNKQPIPDEARKEKVRFIKILEQLNLKVFTLREKFEEHYESEVRIRGTVFPGVVIESHDRYYEVKQKRSHVVFYFDRESGRIKEKPLE